MNKQKINAFLMDVENLHKSVEDEAIKEHLHTEFQKIKEKHLPAEKEKNKTNVYDEVHKLLYNSRREEVEVIPVDVGKFGAPCDDKTRVQQIESVNKKLENIEGEPMMVSLLKGQLLFDHKRSIGVKNFITFLKDTGEKYDYCTFLVKFYKLVEKYKQLKCCRLSVRFVKSKFALVKEVVNNNPKDWE